MGGGVKLVDVLPFHGRKRKQINKIPRKSQENAGTVPGESHEKLFVFIESTSAQGPTQLGPIQSGLRVSFCSSSSLLPMKQLFCCRLSGTVLDQVAPPEKGKSFFSGAARKGETMLPPSR